LKIFEHEELHDNILTKLEVIYVTRIQKERFPDPKEYARILLIAIPFAKQSQTYL
jgi:aspartate carbamoyltransferase catalytic subunit